VFESVELAREIENVKTPRRRNRHSKSGHWASGPLGSES
jgi:hypothetical protein